MRSDTRLAKECDPSVSLWAGWTRAVNAPLGTADAGYFRLRFDRGGRAVAAWANLRAALFGLPYGDQGLLIRQSLYARVGGYPDIPLMEDVALVRALRGHLVRLDATAVTSAERYRKQGWVRRGARNCWTLARYFAGADVAALARATARVPGAPQRPLRRQKPSASTA